MTDLADEDWGELMMGSDNRDECACCKQVKSQITGFYLEELNRVASWNNNGKRLKPVCVDCMKARIKRGRTPHYVERARTQS